MDVMRKKRLTHCNKIYDTLLNKVIEIAQGYDESEYKLPLQIEVDGELYDFECDFSIENYSYNETVNCASYDVSVFINKIPCTNNLYINEFLSREILFKTIYQESI